MLRHRIISALISLGMMLSPVFCYAHAPMPAPEFGYFATPMSMRGQFVFITKISRRQLRAMLLEQTQENTEPVLVRTTI